MIKHLKRILIVTAACLGMYCGGTFFNNDITEVTHRIIGIVLLYIVIVFNELWSGENW